jgi:hypothetical protein
VEFLVPLVVVYVHEIDTAAHPTIVPGWRWAVMVGGRPPHDLDFCANSGWAPDRKTALIDGEQVGVAAARAARMFGVPCDYKVAVIGHDPIPPGEDRLHTLMVQRSG